MKRCPLCFLLVMLVLSIAPQASLAQTFAFIPNDNGNVNDDNVTRVDTTDETFDRVTLTDTLTTVAPFGAAVTPDGAFVLVTRRGDLLDPDDFGSVTLIPTASFSTTTAQTELPVGGDPAGVAVDSQGRFAYVANFADDTLSRIVMASRSVSLDPIPTGVGPFGVAAIFDEVDNVVKVYVSNNTANTVSVIFDDGVTATNEVDIIVGTSPVGVALSPDGEFLYVANNGTDINGNSMTIVQTSDNTVLATLPLSAGSGPWGVAVGSDGDFIYVSNSSANSVSVIAADTLTVQNNFPVGNQPMGIAAPKFGDFAYVVNQTDDTISRIDIGTQSVTTIGSEEISNASALGAFIGGTPPNAPSDLAAEAPSFDRIELDWTDNSDDELGFKIERRIDSEDEFTQIGTVAADVTTFLDSTLSGETTANYRVRAFNEVADSDFSAEASATTEEGRFSWCFIDTLMR